jgi:hypothetical protein
MSVRGKPKTKRGRIGKGPGLNQMRGKVERPGQGDRLVA